MGQDRGGRGKRGHPSTYPLTAGGNDSTHALLGLGLGKLTGRAGQAGLLVSELGVQNFRSNGTNEKAWALPKNLAFGESDANRWRIT